MAAGGTGVEGAGSGAVGPPFLLGCQSGRGLPLGVRACSWPLQPYLGPDYVLVAKSCQTRATLDSPGKNTGVGGHFLLQGIFPTQE